MSAIKDRPVYTANGETLKLDQARCIGCGFCLDVCPHAVFEPATLEGRPKVSIAAAGRCMECGACVGNCPAHALSVAKGVGCVAAIVQGKLRGTAPSCDCGGDDKGSACC